MYRGRFLPQIGGGGGVRIKQPDHAFGYRLQKAHPSIEERGRYLETAVEAAKDEGIIWQTACGPAWRVLSELTLAVVRLVGVWQPNNALAVERRILGRHHRHVGDDIIDGVHAQRTGKRQVTDLNRRRSERKDAQAVEFRVAGNIDENIEVVPGNARGGFAVRKKVQIVEAITADLNFFARGAPVTHAARIAEDFKMAPVVQAQHFDREKGDRMRPEVTRDVSDAKFRSCSARSSHLKRGGCVESIGVGKASCAEILVSARCRQRHG